MDNQQAEIPTIRARTTDRSISLSLSLTLPQIQTAAEWLAGHTHPNPDLKIALNLVLQGWIIPQETGERMAIAVEQTQCTRPTRVCLWAFEVMYGG